MSARHRPAASAGLLLASCLVACPAPSTERDPGEAPADATPHREGDPDPTPAATPPTTSTDLDSPRGSTSSSPETSGVATVGSTTGNDDSATTRSGAGSTGTDETSGTTQDVDTSKSNDSDAKDPDTSAQSAKARIRSLLRRAENVRTDDLEALGALQQAAHAGASDRQLARSANRRGERLHSAPDRAIRFFEWANRRDKKYPNASFNLAKIAANRGELAQAKVHIREVAKRKGKALLRTIEYDPTFAVLADDPEIRRLLK